MSTVIPGFGADGAGSESRNRFVLFPIQEREMWDFYKKQVACFWVTEEIDLSSDMIHWNTRLSESERNFIKMVLAFFSSSDGIVAENLALRFYKDVEIPEARCFYGFQIAMENIHAEMYSQLIEAYIQDVDERAHIFRAMETIPAVREKAKWALRWIESETASFGERLVAFACVEGIFFSSSFCAIFWLKKRGLMPGLATSNEFISRDEGMHCDFACLLFRKLSTGGTERNAASSTGSTGDTGMTGGMTGTRPGKEIVQDIVRQAVECEKLFVKECLPVNVIGMNAELMLQYVEFCADRLLVSLDVPKIWNTRNPFDWMELISLPGKTNFFEKRVSEYRKAGVGTSKESRTFEMVTDF